MHHLTFSLVIIPICSQRLWDRIIKTLLELCNHYSGTLNLWVFSLGTPGQYRNEVPTRPEVMAAMFFAAGMAFERQVDSACRLRMYRATDDPLLPGETPLLSGGNTPFLLEDVSPTFRRDSSANPEVKEVTFECFFPCRTIFALLVMLFHHLEHNLPRGCLIHAE